MDILPLLLPLFLPLLGLIIALASIRQHHLSGGEALGSLLMWQLAVGLGLGLIWAGIGHLLMPDMVAQSIGWPTGSPFQREVGLWDLALGVVGILCLKFRDEGFWTAAVIGTGIFYAGAGLGHLYELLMHGNTAVNNAGAVLYMDLLYPLVLGGLLILYHSQRNAGARGGGRDQP